MATYFTINDVQGELVDFQGSIERFDMDHVKRQTLKEAATTLAEMVRQAVVAEDDIKTPASLHSKYDSGDGYSMSTRKAWRVKKSGDGYIVRPHPEVEQRATVLNAGWGRITPNDEDVLKFNINGVPVYAKSVSGPDRTGYWQAALRRFENSGELERIAVQELREEALK